MNNLELQPQQESQQNFLVPTFTLDDVLGVQADDQELEYHASDREWKDVILEPGSIDQHLGIFIAAVRGELQAPVDDIDTSCIRVTHRTTRIFEKAGLIFHEPALSTNTELVSMPRQIEEHIVVQLAAD